MIYNNFNSSAVKSIEILDNLVKVVYNSDINKEYTFSCQNVDEFQDQLSAELIDVELNNGKGSVGRFLFQQIRNGRLVESK